MCSRDDFYKVVKREVRKIGYHWTIEDCEYQTKGHEMKFNLLGSNSTEMKAFNSPSLTLGEINILNASGSPKTPKRERMDIKISLI